ncbi:hypothetical protein J2X20_005713 [Pelomonas saccharophila]|uniref:Uncharacterized protein n=1 Tax=Roseateles saccharophilus TaxID=304 RepID=A0ABU1YWF3_ROSSA|nr:hypothetical protein [Roseateles saccharophilus]MDR7273028.1 hypothetical protein [Roseateles saccharophilus]
MPKTSLREVLEAIASKEPGISNEKDAVALLDLHLGLVQECQHTDAPAKLIKVRDGARKALQTTFQVRTESMLARSHADPLEKALAPLERLIERTQTEEKPEQARFDKRWDQLGERVGKLLVDIEKSKFGGSPGKPMEDALQALQRDAKAVIALKAELDFTQANKMLDQVEKDLLAFDKAFVPINDKAKDEYLEIKAKLQATMAKMDPAVAADKFGSPPHPHFDVAVDFYVKMRALMDKGEQDNDYLVAKRGAKGINDAFSRQLRDSFASLKTDWQKSSGPAQKLIDGIAAGAFPGADGKALKTAMSQATEAMKQVESSYECAAAGALMAALDKAVAAVRITVAQGLIKAGTKTPKEARSKVVAMLKHDPEAMKALADEPGGKEWLDAMVGGLGGKAKDADSKAFVNAAITARFGPELQGKVLTTKYLPRLYKVLGMVPASHTLSNDMLATINRTRTKLETSGDYQAGHINLKAPRTGIGDAMVSFGAWVLPEKLIGKQLPGGVSQFDQLTLHEVGHAVDDKKKFMDGKTGAVSFGGWQKHKIEEVAQVLGDALGFFDAFAELGKPFLKAYLTAVLQKKKAQEDGTVTAALPNGAKPDWKKLAKHAAVDHAENIRLKSDSKGLWDRGDSGAAKYAIGGSVFQQSYGHEWVSYALSARSAKVTDYQFRADGEWYAEAYAAFFLGKLKESHPLHAILTKDKQSTEAAKRAAR